MSAATTSQNSPSSPSEFHKLGKPMLCMRTVIIKLRGKTTAKKEKAALNPAALNVNESGDLIWVEEPEQVEPQLRKGLKTGLYSKT